MGEWTGQDHREAKTKWHLLLTLKEKEVKSNLFLLEAWERKCILEENSKSLMEFLKEGLKTKENLYSKEGSFSAKNKIQDGRSDHKWTK